MILVSNGFFNKHLLNIYYELGLLYIISFTLRINKHYKVDVIIHFFTEEED